MIKILTFLKRFFTQFTKNINKLSELEQIPVEKGKQQYEHIANLARAYDGRLLIRHELKISDNQLQHLLDQNVITQIKAIEKVLFNFTCNRCGNNDQTLFGRMPCITCQRESVYCRNCIKMGRVLECDYLYYFSTSCYSWPTFKSPCTWKGKLNPHQQRAADKLLTNITIQKDTLVWSVTGSGKTEMIFPVITKSLQLGKRVCIATPRKDVVRELLPRCQAAFESIPIQALYGGSHGKEENAQFVISTTHQLIRFKHAFDIIIIDEIDAFPYHADKTLPYVTQRAQKKNGVTIYLTATPRREQKWQMKLKLLDYIFVPSRYHGHPLPVPKMQYCFNLNKYLQHHKVPPSFTNWLNNRQRKDRQLLIFVPTIKLATQLTLHLTKILKQQSIIYNEKSMTSVHSEDKDRDQKVDLFRQKKLTVLITTTILERGVTFPSVDVVVLHACHSVFDESALIQIAGRAGRSKDDPTGEVMFFHEGKTDAMINARQSIIDMNNRAKKMKRGGKSS